MTDKEYIEKYGQEQYDLQMEQIYTEEESKYFSASPEEQLYLSISEELESFNNFTEEQQDYFLSMAQTIIKYRGKSLYDDLPEDIENDKLSNIEKMVQQLLKEKSSRSSKIEVIPNKKHLSVEEFEYEFKISSSKQQQLRGRGMPILKRQTNNSKIVYEYDEVKKWIANNGI